MCVRRLGLSSPRRRDCAPSVGVLHPPGVKSHVPFLLSDVHEPQSTHTIVPVVGVFKGGEEWDPLVTSDT